MIKLKRLLVIAVTILVCFLLQVLAFPAIPGLLNVPNCLLAAVVSFGFLYGKGVGLAAAVVSGLLLDVLGSGIPGFYTLIFSILGYLNGFMSEKVESENLLVLTGLLLGNAVICHLYVFIFAFLIRKSYRFGAYFTSVFLPEFLLTTIFFIVLYGILVFLSKRWDLKSQKGEVKVL